MCFGFSTKLTKIAIPLRADPELAAVLGPLGTVFVLVSLIWMESIGASSTLLAT